MHVLTNLLRACQKCVHSCLCAKPRVCVYAWLHPQFPVLTVLILRQRYGDGPSEKKHIARSTTQAADGAAAAGGVPASLKLFNMYGQTESTVSITLHSLSSGSFRGVACCIVDVSMFYFSVFFVCLYTRTMQFIYV